MRRIFFILALSILAILLADCSGRSKKNMELTGPRIPPFVGKKADGKLLSENSISRKIAVLGFLSSWCKPCVNEIIALDSLRKKYDDDKIEFMIFTYEDPSKLKKITDSLKTEIPIIHADSSFFSELNIDAIPTRILAKNGYEILRVVGSPIEHEDSFLRVLSETVGERKHN